MMRKKRVTICMAIAFVLSIMPLQAFALGTVQVGSNDRAIELLDASQQDMLKSIQHDSRHRSNRAASKLSIGSDTKWTTGNITNDGQDYTGTGISYRTTSNSRVACRSCVTGAGSANGWAYVGREVSVSGSGSRDAEISFKGNYKGKLLVHNPEMGSASAGVRVRVSVVDMTNGGSELDAEQVFEKSIDVQSFPKYDRTLSAGCQVKLRANHTYRFIIGINTSAEASGACDADSDFWSSDQNFGVDVDSFKVEWM